ncbi:MAG: SNF2-related protein [Desulfurococcaceae archaeon]
MSLDAGSDQIHALLRVITKPLFKYNPFFTLYINPFYEPPSPDITSRPYYNYIHQVSLLLDMIPRTRVKVLIGDEVGLGKTVEAIRLIKYLVTTNQANKILIIAPKALIKQWIYHDMRDLLYAPGYVKRITRKKIDNILESFRRGLIRKAVFLVPIDLAKRGSMDKHAWGGFKPYYEFISSFDWDLVVIDEAHQLGFTPPLSLRTKRLAPVCTKVKHLVLLSATPSRGTHEDMLGRVSLLIPELEGKVKEIAKRSDERRQLYRVLSNYIVYRRTKDFVNELEGRRVFPELSALMALIKLGDKKELYQELNKVLSEILKHLNVKPVELVKIIVLKRALSSPWSFIKTITRVLERGSSQQGSRLSSKLLDELFTESKVDEVVEEALRSVVGKLPSSMLYKVSELLLEFENLYREGDPCVKALAHLLYHVLVNPGYLPRDLLGDYVVFSEYRDTVEYVFNYLVDFFRSRGFKASDVKQLIIERTLKKYHEKKDLSSTRKYSSLLDNSMEILVDETMGKWIILVKLSSLNQDVIHLLPEVFELAEEIVGASVLKVLISTDIASEGLNLHQFNVVVNYDVPWSPVKREQRIGRVYRLRQVRNCTVIDFVRDVEVDYEFYTKLVLKLLNMIEQRITSKPLEGVIELHVLKKQQSSEEYLQVLEKDIASALCRVYEDYYSPVNRRPLSEILNNIRAELAKKLIKYRDLYEELAPSSKSVESTKRYVKELTGCSDHEHFTRVVCALFELLYKTPCTLKPGSEPRLLLRIYDKLREANTSLLDSELVLVVREPRVEKGFLGVVDLYVNGSIRYSTPVLVLYRNGESKLVHGVELLEWLVEGLRKGLIGLTRVSSRTSTDDERSFEENVRKLVESIEFLFFERIFSKSFDVSKLTGEQLVEYPKIEAKLSSPVIRVIGAVGLAEYEEFLSGLPEEMKAQMERESVEHVKSIYEMKGCNVLEVNIGVPKPYDMLVECLENGEAKVLMIEVKSHLKKVLVAELTPAETELAEKNPENYIVCNVAGMENPDKSSWITICESYGKLRKQLIVRTKEERVAKLFFDSY